MTLCHSFDNRDTCVQCGANRLQHAGVNCPKGFFEDLTAEREQLHGDVRAWRERCQRLGDRRKTLEQQLANLQAREAQLRKAVEVERSIGFVGWFMRKIRRYRRR